MAESLGPERKSSGSSTVSSLISDGTHAAKDENGNVVCTVSTLLKNGTSMSRRAFRICVSKEVASVTATHLGSPVVFAECFLAWEGGDVTPDVLLSDVVLEWKAYAGEERDFHNAGGERWHGRFLSSYASLGIPRSCFHALEAAFQAGSHGVDFVWNIKRTTPRHVWLQAKPVDGNTIPMSAFIKNEAVDLGDALSVMKGAAQDVEGIARCSFGVRRLPQAGGGFERVYRPFVTLHNFQLVRKVSRPKRDLGVTVEQELEEDLKVLVEKMKVHAL